MVLVLTRCRQLYINAFVNINYCTVAAIKKFLEYKLAQKALVAFH